MLCISLEILGSIISCMFLNNIMPQTGLMVLGLCGASCAVIPASLFEGILRRLQWNHKILIEDIKWYKRMYSNRFSLLEGWLLYLCIFYSEAEDGCGQLERPQTYRQYILKPTHKKMNYGLMFNMPNKGLYHTFAYARFAKYTPVQFQAYYYVIIIWSDFIYIIWTVVLFSVANLNFFNQSSM